jgi:uncharacterized protein (TIRG00374 family)
MGRRGRLATYVVSAIVVGLGIHVAYPAIAGLGRSLELLRHADVGWIVAAVGCSALSLGCYVAVFRYVVGAHNARIGWGGAYQIAMASQAASTVVTAGGAGGIALLLWALTRAGLDRAKATSRVVAFLAFHYVIYLGALVVFGSALWLGILPGRAPASLTILPAVIAAAAIVLAGWVAQSPERVEGRLSDRSARGGRLARLAQRLLDVPTSVAAGLRYARSLLRPRSRGLVIVALAVGYWATNIAILGACFEAFGERPQVAGLVQAFFVGMTVNLLPLLPGGVGSVEAGLIGALLAFGEPGAEVVVSVLAYRLIGFWLPTVPEALAYVQLRRTAARWTQAPPGGHLPRAAA